MIEETNHKETYNKKVVDCEIKAFISMIYRPIFRNRYAKRDHQWSEKAKPDGIQCINIKILFAVECLQWYNGHTRKHEQHSNHKFALKFLFENNSENHSCINAICWEKCCYNALVYPSEICVIIGHNTYRMKTHITKWSQAYSNHVFPFYFCVTGDWILLEIIWLLIWEKGSRFFLLLNSNKYLDKYRETKCTNREWKRSCNSKVRNIPQQKVVDPQ